MNKVRLGDIATLITKGTTPTSVGFEFVDDGINFVKIESIDDDGTFLPTKFAHINAECNEKLKRSQLQENDILFSIAGAIGRTAIVTKDILPANTNQALAIIRIPNGVVDYKYLIYALESDSIIEQANKNKQGVAQLNLSLQNINDFVIPLFTEEKQKEIVSSLSLLDDLISARKQQLSKLDELVKSRFIELFGEPLTNSKGWKTECLFSVAPTKQIPFELSGKVWLLNLDAVESNTGTVLFKNIVSNNEVNASTVMFSTDNVLYSKLRPYLNKVVLPDDKGVATSELLPLYPDKTKLNRVYLCYWLRNDAFVKHISEKVAGAKMPRVSMDYFRSIDIELPPIDLQNQFAEFVEQTDKSKLEIKESLEKLETLKKSLMQKYFG